MRSNVRPASLCLVLALVASPSLATGYSYTRPLDPATGHAVLFDTDDGEAASSPGRFLIVTSHGDLIGDAFRNRTTVQVHVSLGVRSAVLTLGPSDDVDSLIVTLAFAGIGTMEFRIDDNGEVRVISHDLGDCRALARSHLYLAIVEAKQEMESNWEGLDPADPRSTDHPAVVVYLIARLMAHLPDVVAECAGTGPLYGVCVGYPGYAECMTCCRHASGISKVIGTGCAFFGLASGSPWAGACIAFFGGDSCHSDVCTGKKGDPRPRKCGADGVCKFACDDPAHGCGGDCPDGLVCCCGEPE